MQRKRNIVRERRREATDDRTGMTEWKGEREGREMPLKIEGANQESSNIVIQRQMKERKYRIQKNENYREKRKRRDS